MVTPVYTYYLFGIPAVTNLSQFRSSGVDIGKPTADNPLPPLYTSFSRLHSFTIMLGLLQGASGN
jgi:hypothetical protein